MTVCHLIDHSHSLASNIMSVCHLIYHSPSPVAKSISVCHLIDHSPSPAPYSMRVCHLSHHSPFAASFLVSPLSCPPDYPPATGRGVLSLNASIRREGGLQAWRHSRHNHCQDSDELYRFGKAEEQN